MLVAEDDRVSQRVMQALLTNRGCQVALAANGPDAFKAAVTGRYDLVFLDLQLPLMDGLAVCRAIRAQEALDGGRHLLLVALTAHASVAWAKAATEAGMDRYLTKPMLPSDITNVLQLANDGLGEVLADGGDPLAEKSPVPGLSTAAALQMLTVFLEDAPELMHRLRIARQTGDRTQFEQTAHRLAGALAYVDAGMARDMAISLEAEPDHPEVATRITELEDRLEAHYARLNAWLAQDVV